MRSAVPVCRPAFNAPALPAAPAASASSFAVRRPPACTRSCCAGRFDGDLAGAERAFAGGLR